MGILIITLSLCKRVTAVQLFFLLKKYYQEDEIAIFVTSPAPQIMLLMLRTKFTDQIFPKN